MVGQMMRRSAVTLLVVGLFFLLAGPASAGVDVWTRGGLEGAAIRSVLVDPASPATIYVGTLGSGVFKSTDGGATWAPAGAAQLAGRTVRALVTDWPTGTTIYAGVEDAVNAANGGVFKTVNGGTSWDLMDAGLSNKKVQALAWDGTSLYAGTREEKVNPTDPNPVTGGVFKWTGTTWALMNNGLDNQSVAPRAGLRRRPPDEPTRDLRRHAGRGRVQVG